MTTPSNGHYKRYDYRCPSCGRLWFRAHLPINAIIAIRCTKCSLFYVIGKDTDGIFIREDNNQRERILASKIENT